MKTKEITDRLLEFADRLSRRDKAVEESHSPLEIYKIEEDIRDLRIAILHANVAARITIAEAAEKVGVSKASLGRWVQQGRLKAYKGEYGPTLVVLSEVIDAKKHPLPNRA